MKFDIIYVTYNSEKWIEKCFKSICKLDYDLQKISITVVDNNSTDNTVKMLREIEKKIKNKFFDIKIISLKYNSGFGEGNNIGFKHGNSENVCFFNIDTEVYPDTLTNLEQEIENSKSEVGLWELRQFPYEHPKFYDILTGYTSWSSGAAFAMKRKLYEELKGFDPNIFMYAEDVDLSWRIRAKGYELKYCPKATIKHYSYESAGEVKPNQYFNSIINNLMLRYRFGDTKTILNGHIMLLSLMKHKGPFEHSRKELLKRYLKHFGKIYKFAKWRFENKGISKEFRPNFLAWDYEITRDGAFYENEFSKLNPLVSIIVRTCNRPSVLRETLISLKNQTYKNFEVVIVEDGKNTAEEMIKDEFSDLNVQYHYTGKNVGRSKVGNIGMELANGEYINFLDDDDLFYAEHIEALVYNIENSKYGAVYSLAYETPILIESKEPYKYKEIYHNLVYNCEFNKLILFHHNYIPIQAIMFRKSLFEKYGGFDEKLDALEDWDLWVKYALNSNYKLVKKVTSVYRVPFDKQVSQERQKSLDDSLNAVRNKHKTYLSKISVNEVALGIDNVLNSYTIKLSKESINNIEKRHPVLYKVIISAKNTLKKRI